MPGLRYSFFKESEIEVLYTLIKEDYRKLFTFEASVSVADPIPNKFIPYEGSHDSIKMQAFLFL